MKSNLFKRIITSLNFRIARWWSRPSKDPIEELIANGNLILGENCLLQNFSIIGNDFKKKVKNVIIGNDCHLMGQIILHSSEATVIIGNRVFVGPDTKLFCRENITIQDDVMISWGCTLIDTNAHSLKSTERLDDVIAWKKGFQYKNWDVVKNAPIVIQSNSWIGFNSIITKGVTIFAGTIVGCGSVVTKSTEPNSVVGGNPAAFIKYTT